jgi:hypothetical protein
MISVKAVVRAVGLGSCLASLACVGCGSFMDAMQLKVPTAGGTWTGRLVAVTARDFDGREYRVAALNLETGPRITGGTYESEGAEGLPLAVLTPGGVGAIALDDTGVRPGSKVKVSGKMLMTSAVAPADPSNGGGLAAGRRAGHSDEWPAESIERVAG